MSGSNQTETIARKHTGPGPTTLRLYREYETYQASLAVFTKDGLDTAGCFRKVVLYLIKWMKGRIAGPRNDAKEVLHVMADQYDLPQLRSLADYPDPEDVAADPPAFEDMSFSIPLELQVLSDLESDGWVMRLSEPDNGAEGKKITNRGFVTETAVYRMEKSVSLSVRTICREPSDAEQDAEVFRPAFLRSMMLDSQLLLVEEGLDKRYAFTRRPLVVQISKGQKTRDFIRYFLGDENRQKPLILCTEDTYSGQEGASAAELIDGIAQKIAGYGYVVVLDGNTENLFSRQSGCLSREYNECLQHGNYLLYLGYKPEEDPEERMTCILEEGEQDTEDVEKLKECLEQAAQRIMDSSRRRSYSYHDHVFFNEARNRRLDSLIATGKEGPETIRQLKASLDDTERALEGCRVDNARLSSEKDRASERVKSLNNALSRQDSQISRLQNDLEKEKERAKKLEEEVKRLAGEKDTIKQLRRVDASVVQPMLELAFSYQINDKKDVLRWIREQFSETLIVHSRAERMFLSCGRNIDMSVFCKMIFLLSRYTAIRNENAGRSMTEEEVMEQIKLCDIGFGNIENEHVGGIEHLKRDIREKYDLDISEHDSSRTGMQVMHQHVKYQVDPSSLIRIYYIYDEAIGKSIIGVMPDHLPNKKTANM